MNIFILRKRERKTFKRAWTLSLLLSPHFHSLWTRRVTTFYSTIHKKQKLPSEIIADISNYNLTEREILSIIFNNNYFLPLSSSLPTIFSFIVHRSVNVSNFHFEMNYKNLKFRGLGWNFILKYDMNNLIIYFSAARSLSRKLEKEVKYKTDIFYVIIANVAIKQENWL